MERTHGRALLIVLTVLAFSAIVAACSTQPATPTPAARPTVELESTVDSAATTIGATIASPTPQPQSTVGAAADGIASTVSARTPVPTPTLSAVDQKINQIADATGIAGKAFLGLSVTDWVNIVISMLIVLVGYLLSSRWLLSALRWLARRTEIKLDNKLLDDIGKELQWLLVIVFTRFAVMRLDFITGGLRRVADDTFFLLLLGVGTVIALRLVNFAVTSYMQTLSDADSQGRLDAVMTAARRLGEFFVWIIALSIGMDHFGISVSALSAAMLVAGVVVALGAKGVIADVISGFIILVDQPFRVGDRIMLQDLNTSGTVQNIGTRTTHIRTHDNREVIIPNSKISESQVVNYNFPNPEYRIQIDIGVAYGSDADQVRQVITQAVRSVKGVLPDKAVDVFFHAWGDSAKTIRVRWWVDSYGDRNQLLDQVNAALEVALADAHIDTPFNTYDLNVVMEGKGAGQSTPAPPDDPPNSTS